MAGSPKPRSSDGLGDLAARHRLDDGQRAQLQVLLQLLETDPLAPTSGAAAARALDVHLADSLAALELDALSTAATIADIGAGAGLPGLVLAVALPSASVALVESNARKCAFIERARDEMNLGNARVVCSRAEEWDDASAGSDAVTARALAPQPVVLEYAAPLLRLGGVLVDWRGGRDEPEEQAALRAAAQLGMARTEVRVVQPFPDARRHHLHVFTKIGDTPARFPRRVGIARKRPLG